LCSLIVGVAPSLAASPTNEIDTSNDAKQTGSTLEEIQPNNGTWIVLIGSGEPQGFSRIGQNITLCGDVHLAANRHDLVAEQGSGVVAALTSLGLGKENDLLSKEAFGDCEVQLEFLLGKGSNSGVKLQQRYEIQLYDSHGKEKPSGTDCGGIYPHWVSRRNGGGMRYIDQGVPPSLNAAKPAGRWQQLQIEFRAPRFNDRGEKTENARFSSVKLNGKVIHRNVELDSPTGYASSQRAEVPTAPLYLQMDHGPVAFRNVRVKPLDGDYSDEQSGASRRRDLPGEVAR